MYLSDLNPEASSIIDNNIMTVNHPKLFGWIEIRFNIDDSNVIINEKTYNCYDKKCRKSYRRPIRLDSRNTRKIVSYLKSKLNQNK